jgi:hypothetical protein
MSVAGDHQEALRRELARAECGGGGTGGSGSTANLSNCGTGSGGQTPQRRFSRTQANGSSSRKISSIRGVGGGGGSDEMNGGGGGTTMVELSVAEQLKLTRQLFNIIINFYFIFILFYLICHYFLGIFDLKIPQKM